jgi:hypothetical protein
MVAAFLITGPLHPARTFLRASAVFLAPLFVLRTGKIGRADGQQRDGGSDGGISHE